MDNLDLPDKSTTLEIPSSNVNPSPQHYSIYTVQQGDNWNKIAFKSGCSM